jgi:hypothetical protein
MASGSAPFPPNIQFGKLFNIKVEQCLINASQWLCIPLPNLDLDVVTAAELLL